MCLPYGLQLKKQGNVIVNILSEKDVQNKTYLVISEAETSTGMSWLQLKSKLWRYLEIALI